MIQSKSDPPLVPKEEADQVADMLMKRGNIVYHYPAERRGFAKRENQIDAIRWTIDWFEKYLPANATAAGQSPGSPADAASGFPDLLNLLQSCSSELKVRRSAMIRRDDRRNF